MFGIELECYAFEDRLAHPSTHSLQLVHAKAILGGLHHEYSLVRA